MANKKTNIKHIHEHLDKQKLSTLERIEILNTLNLFYTVEFTVREFETFKKEIENNE